MSSTLGLEIGSVRRQRARWPGFGGILALAGAGLCIVIDPPLPGLALGLLVALAGLAAWTGWRSGMPGETGRLLVDPAGSAGWLGGPPADRARAVPLVPLQWRLGDSEVWLLARDGSGARLHLRIGRPDCDERQWRALRRWLVWSGRAGATPMPP